MPQRRYEERVTRGGITVRQDGAVIHEPRSPARPEPVLPPVYDATRAAGPLSIAHVHSHSDGHGRSHSHLHVHAGDNRHSGDGHPHTPGNPGAGMPSAQLNSASPDPGDEMRDVSGISLAEQITAYLEGQGVDVGRAIAEASYEREHKAQRARAQAGRAQDLARALRKAKRALAFEQQGFLDRAPGFGIAKVSEAQLRVDQLTAGLGEAACNDPEIIGEAKRRAAR